MPSWCLLMQCNELKNFLSYLISFQKPPFYFTMDVLKMERDLNSHSVAEYSFNMLQLILVECCVQLKYQQWGFNRAQSCCKFQFLARMSILYVPSVCYLTKQRILSYCSRSKMYDSCLHILLQNRNKEISLITCHASLTSLFPLTLQLFGNKNKMISYLFTYVMRWAAEYAARY